MSFQGKKRSFERILEADLRGASSLWLRTSWSLRSSLFGSNLHLTLRSSTIPLNTGSHPMGQRRKNCVAYPNSVKIILDSLETRSHWKELSTPRHEGFSLSTHLLIKNVFSFPYLLFHAFILLDSLVTSIDLVDYIVFYHVFFVVFHLLQIILSG